MITLDIETTPDPRRPSGMRMTIASSTDVHTLRTYQYTEDTIGMILDQLDGHDLVIGYNIVSFDLRVLSDYARRDLTQLHNVLDLYRDLIERTGQRDISLDELAQGTLGRAERQHGGDLYKTGQFRLLREVSRNGAWEIAKIYRAGQRNSYVSWIQEETGFVFEIPVSWA